MKNKQANRQLVYNKWQQKEIQEMPPGFFTPIILNSQFTHNQLLSTNTCPQDNVYIEANFELLN